MNTSKAEESMLAVVNITREVLNALQTRNMGFSVDNSEQLGSAIISFRVSSRTHLAALFTLQEGNDIELDVNDWGFTLIYPDAAELFVPHDSLDWVMWQPLPEVE